MHHSVCVINFLHHSASLILITHLHNFLIRPTPVHLFCQCHSDYLDGLETAQWFCCFSFLFVILLVRFPQQTKQVSSQF